MNNSLSYMFKKMFLKGTLNVNYVNEKKRMDCISAIFDANPIRSYDILDSLYSTCYSNSIRNITLNKLKQESESTSKTVNINAQLSNDINMNGDMLSLHAGIKSKSTDDDRYSLYQLNYIKYAKEDDNRRIYQPNSTNTVDMDFGARYNYYLADMYNFIYLSYRFNYQYKKENNLLYRLDWLDDSTNTFNAIPSNQEQLYRSLDSNNTYNYTENDYIHHLEISYNCLIKLRKKGHSLEASVGLPVNIMCKNMDYYRINPYSVYRNACFFDPVFHVGYNVFSKEGYQCLLMTVNFTSEVPSLVNLVDYIDDSNPLYIIKGNANLTNIHNKNVNIGYSNSKNAHHEYYNLGVTYHYASNAIAYGYVFDKQSGVTTMMPTNTNGNWNISCKVGYGRAIDKNEKLMFDYKLNADYINSVDLNSVAGQSTNTNSEVRNFNINNVVKFDFKVNGKVQLAAKAQCKFDHIIGTSEDFTTINAADFSYGMSSVVELPWKIQLTTDITEFSHRGYSNKAMNTNELIWNMRLAKSFIKGNLTFMMDVYDVFGNLTNKRYFLNSQGRTETLTNVIPQYAMIHLQYKLNKQPKKRH